jgi:hypothetical protein
MQEAQHMLQNDDHD